MERVSVEFIGCLMLVLSILLAGGCVVLWFSFVIVRVENNSMEPTLKHGERVLMFRLWPDRWLRRGQVVIILPLLRNRPETHLSRTVKPGRKPFIKRIVGLQGDIITARIADRNSPHEAYDPTYNSNGQRTWHIPPRHIFVLGDNYPRGEDSLVWGPIPEWNVLGIALLKLPIGRLGLRERARYADTLTCTKMSEFRRGG